MGSEYFSRGQLPHPVQRVAPFIVWQFSPVKCDLAEFLPLLDSKVVSRLVVIGRRERVLGVPLLPVVLVVSPLEVPENGVLARGLVRLALVSEGQHLHVVVSVVARRLRCVFALLFPDPSLERSDAIHRPLCYGLAVSFDSVGVLPEHEKPLGEPLPSVTVVEHLLV